MDRRRHTSKHSPLRSTILYPHTIYTTHYTTHYTTNYNTMLSTSCTMTGTLLLLHAAYSCLHFKALLQELDISIDADDEGRRRVPPPDVIVECALGLVVMFVGQLLQSGGAWQPCVTTSSSSSATASATGKSSGIQRRPLAAPAYKTRDFDVYADRSAAVSFTTAAATPKTK